MYIVELVCDPIFARLTLTTCSHATICLCVYTLTKKCYIQGEKKPKTKNKQTKKVLPHVNHAYIFLEVDMFFVKLASLPT